ncbi:sensor histidine kinase [Xiamenia xianingshaonis]|uniref:Sensor-like histidine kinase SenX3 n=1 Tax=Xiamenia xianingshaonis TaxID=2682776 RepID=A0A9E6MPB5_9ACTN|nr:HAMP domain-containing sensor histidine kinase [Xiamenia xianingshaonis]NHM14090.1 sensor histidine kinase [Xiamenia xianingshaonis]QTU83954.1 HAMP domain-containing histidine kinase [Xiamenia xianingshaonis]
MLKRLRVKFVALNMATVAVVLAVVFTAICVLDYQQSLAQVNGALEATLAHTDPFGKGEPGGFSPPDDGGDPAAGEAPQSPKEADAEPEAAGQTGPKPPRIGGGKEAAVPVAAYAVEDGALVELPTITTASIDDDVLSAAATAVAELPDGNGSLPSLGLYYAKRTTGGETRLAFADMSAANGWMRLALTLAGVGVLALGAFFVISLFFSRWALRPVAEAWERQRQFVADASHDLKTPLTVILANAAIVAEHPERTVASQRQWLESTAHEAKSMQSLVNDLLELAKIDEAQVNEALAPPSETVDVSDVVESELLQMESVAFEADVALREDVAADVRVSGSASQLQRAVKTLLDNAIKYAGAGETVSVTLEVIKRDAVLTVHNTGAPISADDLPHIFDRFYRADKVRNRDDVGGHGLGLAIADAIVRDHGGTLTAASAEDSGTTFTLTLPRVR